MLSLKNKLDTNLRYLLNNKCYKKYRVLIKCKCMLKNISKKIISYKDTIICSLEYSNIICAILKESSIQRLIEYPEVTFITFDEYLFVCANSVSSSNNLNISKEINCTLTGKNIGIGLVDTGVFPHKDLTDNSNRIYEFHDLINNLNYPYDDNGHGTFIAGSIAGNGVSSNGLFKGIAPKANLYCYKAFDKLGKGLTSDILLSIEKIINSSKENSIKILCLPFELLNFNIFIIDAFNKTFLEAQKNKIIVVVPSGSNMASFNSIRGIATLDSCITVSGLKNTFSSEPYTFSSSGPYKNKHKPTIAAACSEITSLNSDKSYISEKDGLKLYPPRLKTSYKVASGTSIACAYICGICALLFEKRPDLTMKDINSLFNLCSIKSDLSKNEVGYGLLDVNKLLSI